MAKFYNKKYHFKYSFYDLLTTMQQTAPLQEPQFLKHFLVACSDSIRHRVGPSVGRLVGRSIGNTFAQKPFSPILSSPKSFFQSLQFIPTQNFENSSKKLLKKNFQKKKFSQKGQLNSPRYPTSRQVPFQSLNVFS